MKKRVGSVEAEHGKREDVNPLNEGVKALNKFANLVGENISLPKDRAIKLSECEEEKEKRESFNPTVTKPSEELICGECDEVVDECEFCGVLFDKGEKIFCSRPGIYICCTHICKECYNKLR